MKMETLEHDYIITPVKPTDYVAIASIQTKCPTPFGLAENGKPFANRFKDPNLIWLVMHQTSSGEIIGFVGKNTQSNEKFGPCMSPEIKNEKYKDALLNELEKYSVKLKF